MQVALELLNAGANVHATSVGGWTCLMKACQNGHVLCARALLKAGADVNHETPKHVTALNMAYENQHEGCATLLLHAGARADIIDSWGDSPLSSAQKKSMQTVLALIQ